MRPRIVCDLLPGTGTVPETGPGRTSIRMDDTFPKGFPDKQNYSEPCRDRQASDPQGTALKRALRAVIITRPWFRQLLGGTTISATVLTVDLEPDWGVRGTRAYREVTPRFLRFLEERGIRATFFVVSDLLEVSEDIVAGIAESHEVASHGKTHTSLTALDGAAMGRELRESRARLQEVAAPVIGFRSPFFARPSGLGRLLRRAGYLYDASLGSVYPGPQNGWLERSPCPGSEDGLLRIPTSAMWRGMFPLSLTWLRLLGLRSLGGLPNGAPVLYLHLHEFLPPETAGCLPWHLRPWLPRNCGEPAWDVFDRTLDALGGEFTTCRDMLELTQLEAEEV